MAKIAVIGGGAAGMMAAYAAAALANGKNQVILYEKNEKLGKKVYITGKGRCNVTNAADMEEVRRGVVSNPRFLYSAFDAFSNQDIMKLLEKAGCPLKIERGQRVFPVSDKSSDIIFAFAGLLRQSGVKICFHTPVREILRENNKVTGVCLANGKKESADAVIVATGGISYASTGSTGDGYRFAEDFGHKITETRPALVPLVCKEDWAAQLQGLALKNIAIRVQDGKKIKYRDFGELLFTHFGVSGPVVLSASSYITRLLEKKELTLLIDLKPALSEEQLDARLLRDFSQEKNKLFKNSLLQLYPARLADIIVALSKISPEKPVHTVTKEERQKIIQITKNLPLTLVDTRDYNEAIVTQGGISVKEVVPSTMESKMVKGLYFAGEVLDLDAVTGGFNLQIAWSTGYLAGISAGEER